jgi:UDP-N-acetylglucosamine/UDP-N-acetylgalactosamine diphosphorylase
MTSRVQALIDRGVIVRVPGSVDIDESVDPARIAPGAILHAGCRISGAATSIGPGCVIGAEAPATIEDCQLGHGVELKGGYFSGATFLDGANVGSAAHIRPGTLLEEEASCAHAAGLKQTIFFPFVTAGSLINFCDALVAGGTSRKDHSEIGSSYIHFNYTPHQDKATASLVGDVPRGVMLDQRPIFLGGQGGLVGPARIEYGCVIPAGVVWRGDALEPGQLLRPLPATGGSLPYDPAKTGNADRIVANNLIYLGSLRALESWYSAVRAGRMRKDPYQAFCWQGAILILEGAVKERVKRLGEFAAKLPSGHPLARHWPALEKQLLSGPDVRIAEKERAVVSAWEAESKLSQDTHVEAVRKMPARVKTAATAWLQAVVDSQVGAWQALLKV